MSRPISRFVQRLSQLEIGESLTCVFSAGVVSTIIIIERTF